MNLVILSYVAEFNSVFWCYRVGNIRLTYDIFGSPLYLNFCIFLYACSLNKRVMTAPTFESIYNYAWESSLALSVIWNSFLALPEKRFGIPGMKKSNTQEPFSQAYWTPRDIWVRCRIQSGLNMVCVFVNYQGQVWDWQNDSIPIA